jgi:hypothetical protein
VSSFAAGAAAQSIIGSAAGGVTMPASDEDQVLVVRFWPEDEAAELPPSRRWRARIIYVNTGQQFYAPSIDEAFAVMNSLVMTGKYQN